MGYISTFFHGQHQPRAPFTSTTRFIISPASPSGELSQASPSTRPPAALGPHRSFHNYFVTHLPSSSLHPDSRSSAGPHHKLPRSASTPHTQGPGASPAVVPPNMPSRDLTVVRIPLRSAKHHFGAYESRGSRSYNEDTNQAGTIDMPAFAKRPPMSLSRGARMSRPNNGEGTSADSAFGDPQIFYFGVFDGHGGSECSEFLRDELHGYIEEAAAEFALGSSLAGKQSSSLSDPRPQTNQRSANRVEMAGEEVKQEMNLPATNVGGIVNEAPKQPVLKGEQPVPAQADTCKAVRLEKELVDEYKNLVGGYFRRFRPQYFDLPDPRSTSDPDVSTGQDCKSTTTVTLESALTYAFLRADLDFISAQARKPDRDDPYADDHPLNKDEVLGSPSHIPPSGHNTIGGSSRFKGGSTASVALISTPTPAPFWHPSASSTLVVAHVGDTRILLCETASGLARPLTSDHHPSSPVESRRLRRFAGSVITDSFGEERIITGLANSRAFGDMRSKRMGVSAEPEITRVELGPGEYSFLVLVSDGVSGTLSDQEIVDVVKEARTPEEGARAVVNYATEISADGDNATCLVVRLGGWERRSEGGVGSLGTKEIRDVRRAEAADPRRGRR
ncbi:protein serine/threonine phosphatase 2C [Coniochaeta ligniaria NRRL 30616]|uniref:Protein serine/threonine phosphatase 2C n=1 Tax=Coniochaeta ligniaria NRRL 30616 TaxID=1408157 RepID=A0A1J7IKZ2_9PEZI|nr:protein serine/threonine phosphatase 2C [Coniochaeta ligniaria NRRL 30616]